MIEPDIIRNKKSSFSFKKLIKNIGPGLLISMAYLDPGNCKFVKIILPNIQFIIIYIWSLYFSKKIPLKKEFYCMAL